MTDYKFEYSKQNVIVRVLIVALLVFLLLFILTFFIAKYIGIWTSIGLTIAIPLLIFHFNRKRIKATGYATLHSDKVIFELDEKKTTFEFKDIKSYKIQDYHGVALNIRRKDKSKFRLLSNDNFCDSKECRKFLSVFERTIEKYNLENESNSSREESLFEKQWFYVLLIVLTLLAVGGLAYAAFFGRARIGSIFISIGALASLWTGYYTTKTRAKKNK